MPRCPSTSTCARTYAWLVCAVAVAAALLVAPRDASAAITMLDPPIQHPGQVTISWNSPQSGSELRWDTVKHTTFDGFPDTLPHDVSNLSGAPGRHSRTISDLPEGTYWYMVRSGTDVAGPFSFQVTDANAGQWQVANLVPAKADRNDPGTVMQSTFSASGSDPDTGKLWVAGGFDRIGRSTAPALSVGTDGSTRPGAPVIGPGTVETAIGDGNGGWYIGGSFTHVAGIEINGIAHILPDGGLDTSFMPGGVGMKATSPDAIAGFQATVYAIELDTVNVPNRLYVGGRFDTWKNPTGPAQDIHNLVAVNPATGARLASSNFNVGDGTSGATDAAPTVDRFDLGTVRAIVADKRAPNTADRNIDNAGVFLGGKFTKVNGQKFSKVAKLEPTGAPAVGRGDCRNSALCFLGNALASASFMMPRITKNGSQQDAVVYALAYWEPRYVGNVGIGDIAAQFQPELAVGGSFDKLEVSGGSPAIEEHENFVEIDSMLGSQLSLFGVGGNPRGPGNEANGTVRSIKVVDTKVKNPNGTGNYSGDKLYAAGDFTSFYGSARNRVARLSLSPSISDTSYTLDAYDPLKDSAVTDVQSIYVQCENLHCGASASQGAGSCTAVYIGGTFHYTNSSNSRRYDNLARTSCSSDALTPSFTPGQAINGPPRALAFSTGNRLFVGGDFSMYEGRRRPGFAAFDVTDGRLSISDDFESWSTGFTGAGATIDTMESRGTTVFVGGSFTHVNGTARANVAKITSGSIASFAPTPNERVRAIHAPGEHGDRVWIGGDFTDAATCTAVGVTCAHLGVLDASSGAPINGSASSTENPDGLVRAFATDGSNVFVGGDFQTVGGLPISTVAKYDVDGRLVDPSDFNVSTGSGAHATALAYSEGSLYVGGVDTWRGDAVGGLVKVDAGDGARDTNFDPVLGPSIDENTVRSLVVAGTRLFVGGGFGSYDGDTNHKYVTTVQASDGTVVDGFEANVTASGTPLVTTITQIGGQTIIGGNLDNFDNRDNRGGFVSVSSPLDTLEPFLSVRGVSLPAGSHVVSDVAGDTTRIVVPYPGPGDTSWSFALVAEAQDQFTSNAATYATTSGLSAVRFDGLAAPWGPTGGETQPGADRGLDTTCRVGGVDQPVVHSGGALAFPPGVTRASVDSCVWTGRIVAPKTGTGRFKLDTGPLASVIVNGVPRTTGDTIELDASRSLPIEVHWNATAGVDPILKWLQVGAETVYTPVPSAAFTGAQAFARTFTLDLGNLPPRDAPAVDLAITARDVDGNPVSRQIAVAMDGAPPLPSTLASVPARELAAVYATNSVVMNVTTSADAGEAGLASQTLRREMRQISGGDCTWTGSAASLDHPLGTIPIAETGYAVPGFNTGLASGCYRFRLIARDNVGNTRTTTLDGHSYDDATSGWIRIDTTLPGGSVTAPVAGAVVHGSMVDVSGSLDKTGAAKIASVAVTYRRVGSSLASAVALAGCTLAPISDPNAWACKWDTSAVDDGPYELQLVATNAAAVSSVPITTNVLVDNDAPTLSELVFTPLSGHAHQVIDRSDPTKLWVRPSASGSARISLRARDGLGTGLTGVTAAVGADRWDFDRMSGDEADGVWAFDYAWSSADAAAEPGALHALVTDGAAHTSNQAFSIAFDDDDPTGLSGGFAAGTVQNGVTGGVRITFAPGTDGAGSGVEDHWIQRVTGLRDAGGTCGGYPAFVDDGETGAVAHNAVPGATFVDASAAPSACYRYRLFVRDRVGNFATLAIGDVATALPAVVADADVRVKEGAASTIGVHLRARPASDEQVTVSVRVGAHTAVPVPAQQLVFTKDNWNDAQAAAFSVIDDLVDQGDVYTGTIVLHVTSAGSAEPRYTSDVDIPASMSIDDNDTAALTLVPGANWKPNGDGAIAMEEGAAGVGVDVRAATRPMSDVVVTPVLPANSQVKVAPASATLRAGASVLDVSFTITTVDDDRHEAARDVQLAWRVATSDPQYATLALPTTKLSITDDDPVTTKREPREVEPATPVPPNDSNPGPTPTRTDPTPPIDREPVPQPQPSTPAPQPAHEAPVVEPREPPSARSKPAPRAEQGSLAKFGDWAKEHKTAAVVSSSVIGLALAKVLGVLHSMPGGLGRFFGQKRLVGRATMELRRRRRSAGNEPLRRRAGRSTPPDILDEIETKYVDNYEDPLRTFERAPGAGRPDTLGDLEARLNGFDMDDAA